MSSNIQENCENLEIEVNIEESTPKIHSLNLKKFEAKNIYERYCEHYTGCNNVMLSAMQRGRNYWDSSKYSYSKTPTIDGRNAYDNLERFYICEIDESKSNHVQITPLAEQPLDFSKKISSHNNNKSPQNTGPNISRRYRENGMHNSDSTDDSCEDELAYARFRGPSETNPVRSPKLVYHSNGSQSVNYEENPMKVPKWMSNGSRNINFEEKEEAKVIKYSFFQSARKNEGGRNEPNASNFSESEDEIQCANSDYRSSSFEETSDNVYPDSPHRIPPVSPEQRKSPHDESQHRITPVSSERRKSPHPVVGETTVKVENGSEHSKEENDQFQIQDVLSRGNQSTRKVEKEQTANQLNDSVTQLSLSPQAPSSSPLSHLPHSPVPVIPVVPPSHSIQLLPSRFPVAANGTSFNTSGMFNPYIPPVHPSSVFANFANHGSQGDVSNYSRFYSYSQGIQPRFNSMYNPAYQQPLHVGQDMQRQKKQRPFKAIDTSTLLQDLQQQQSPTALELVASPTALELVAPPTTLELVASPCIGSTVSAQMNSPPQRQSPDSPCIANGSPGNSNESLPQDASGESSRKKIRRIPPEEKDEKYLEKRRKNNLAAKKSRDERRKKEDLMALDVGKLRHDKIGLIATNNLLKFDLREKNQRIEMLISSLFTFREKLEGRAREMFEETFRSFLPPQ